VKFITALQDPKLFGPHFQGSSYRMWRIVAKVISRVKLTKEEAELFHEISKRTDVPKQVRELCAIMGRRGGVNRNSLAPWPCTWLAFGIGEKSCQWESGESG